MRLAPTIALVAALGLTAGCTQTNGDTDVPEPSDVISGSAGKVLIPARTMAQREARAYAGAAILSRVAADRANREPENQTAVHSALMSLSSVLDQKTSGDWPNLALRDIRVRIYSAMISGSKQRITDYIGAALTPWTVLDGLKAAGLDVSTYAAMQDDVACHFSGLPDAPEKVTAECNVKQPTERSLDELRSIYKAMLARQLERVEAMVGA